jgi:hypothetical protein
MTDDQNKHPEEQVLMEGDPDTTGHVWDGIKEFNNPLPRWWLWTFYATMRLGDRLHGAVSGLAATGPGDPRHPGVFDPRECQP